MSALQTTSGSACLYSIAIGAIRLVARTTRRTVIALEPGLDQDSARATNDVNQRTWFIWKTISAPCDMLIRTAQEQFVLVWLR